MSVLTDLRTLAVHRDFRKLFAVRLVSQAGDGFFQMGLTTLFFFSPEKAADTGAIVVGFTVQLLPFTVLAPLVGPLLDRWRRRQVLLVGNLARAALAVLLAVIMATQGVGWPVYVLALVALGVNRFLLSALSAGLPHVVPRPQLLMANTVTPTLGAVSWVLGLGGGLLLRLLLPEGVGRDVAAVALGAALFTTGGLLALRLGRGRLGPDHPAAGLAAAVRASLAELADGARWLVRRRTPALALGVMSAHRFVYGVNLMALILIARNLLEDPADADAGLATFALLAGLSFAGNGLSIILTPLAHERVSPARWIVVCLGIGAVGQALLATSWSRPVVGAAAVLLGLSVQGAKIAVDTIVQRDTDDAYRGRAFSLYDMLYNAALVGAAALAYLVLPDTGWSRPVSLVLTAALITLAATYGRADGRADARADARAQARPDVVGP